MKSTFKGSAVASTGYPKLMVAKNGDIVLFSDYESGTVVYAAEGSDCDIGYTSDGWNMDAFSDFTGTVTLEN